jgi:transcriptional regulator with PAS, ATPase and Fis domain
VAADIDSLERYDRLQAVQLARAIMRDAFGLELLVVGREGPVAHARGGITASSSEACRASLFSREGFARCDAFYRELANEDGAIEERARACHLGLGALAVPAVDGDMLLAWVVASGFVATHLVGYSPVDAQRIAVALREVDPNLADASGPARQVPIVKGDRIKIVRSILRNAAREIGHYEQDRKARTRATEAERPGIWGILGRSPQMREVFEHMGRIAESDATVLILGESGTGKELVARALYEHGKRSSRPFIVQSCAAISDELLESTLFGHVRGAFSGAIRTGTGLFGAADGGTLFLDEVAEMSPALQVKLLRVLQDGSYLPVGGTTPRKANVRVIAASHRELSEMVARGAFRQDLFYRLHVLPIRLPPLRDRTGDLRLLVEHFLAETQEAPRRVSDAAWTCLERYGWPGNVRELRAEVNRWDLAAAGATEIGPEHLSAAVREAGGYSGAGGGEAAARAAAGMGSLAAAVEALERAVIQRGLERTRGNRTQLAKELGISRTTLNERLRKYDLG